MDPLSISASVAALLALTGTVVQYLKAVKGSSQDSEKILLEVRSVSRLLYQLKELLDNAEEDELSFRTIKSLSAPEGPVRQFKSSLEVLASKLKPVSGWKKAGKALTWPFRKEEIKDILCAIERQKTLFGLALENDHIALSQAIKEHVTEIQAVVTETQVGVTDIQAGVAQLRVRQKDRDEENVLRWLGTTDPSINHNAARTKHQPTTGNWLLKSEKFELWWNKPSQTLWLYGIPGSGKTVLLSTAVNHVKDICSSVSDLGYAYFYFTFRDELKQTREGFLRSIIVQLSSQRPSLPEEVRNLYNVHGMQQQGPPLPDLIRVFFSLLQSFRKTYLMIDALDECAEQDAMLDLITQISTGNQHSANNSVLITSRRERAIEITLQDIVTDSVCIQSKLIEADIRLHVRSQLLHDRQLKRHSGSIKQEIEEALVKGADGMFRWVDCQLESLKKSLSPASIRRALKSLPKTLDETYDRILGSIEEDYRKAAQTALQFLAFSARPLRLNEIVEVVAVVLGGSSGFVEDRLSDPHDILGICSSLVTISRNSSDELSEASSDASSDASSNTSLHDSYEETPQIYLAHYSVKEYLTSDRILAGSASAFASSEIPANRNITELCLTYLSSFDTPGSLTKESRTAFPLLDYVARFWFEHARTAHEEMGLGSVIVEFLKEAKSLTLLNRVGTDVIEAWEELDFHNNSPRVGSPLYYASYCGLSRSAATLVDGGVDVNTQGGYYGNALQAAADRNNVLMIRLLLEAGANVNAQGGRYGNALQGATRRAHVSTIKLLLEAGADVNAQGGFYENALQAATYLNRDVSVIKLLLEAGADVHAQGGQFGNALQSAACYGKGVSVIKLLLEAGADVNAQGCYGNALQAAVTNRDALSAIKLLLEAGADVNAQGGLFGNALTAAAVTSRDALPVIKLLLEAGADVNAQGRYGNALQAAVTNCDALSAIKLLLEAGADVNAQDELFGNALTAAAVTSRDALPVIKLLLEAGADVNAQSGSYSNALQAAAATRCDASPVIKLLLKAGADVNAQGEYLGNALQAAATRNDVSVIKLLLEAGADVNAQGGCYGNALQAAADRNRKENFELLLEHGAVVTHKGDFDSPWDAARHGGKVAFKRWNEDVLSRS